MIVDLRSHIAAAASISALVGDRIVPSRRPQAGKLPAIVYHRIIGDPDYSLKRASGLERTRIQCDCIGARYLDAVGVADALKLVLSGARFQSGSTEFRGVFVDNERDLFDPAPESSEASRSHGVSIDFIVWHRRLQP